MVLQRQAKHDTKVLQQPADHPGIPLLFGASLKEMPVRIVLKFHGEGGLSVYKPAKKSVTKLVSHLSTEKGNWLKLIYTHLLSWSKLLMEILSLNTLLLLGMVCHPQLLRDRQSQK